MSNTPRGTGLKVRQGLRLVAGDPVADVIEDTAAADVAIEMPPMPKAVAEDDDLAELWDAMIPDLYEAQMVSRIDWPSLEMMIRHFHAARQASDDLMIGEPTVWDEMHNRPMKNPSEVVFRSESMAFMAYAKEMGMTFASRARTPSQRGPKGDSSNPFIPAKTG